MAFQLAKNSNFITSSNYNLLSLKLNSFTKCTNSNIKHITKRNLNTSNLLNQKNIISSNKTQKAFFSDNSGNKDINNGPKVKPLEKINHSILELVKLNNNFNPEIHKVVPFYLDSVMLGVIPDNVFQQLKKYNKTFSKNERPFIISTHKVIFSEFVNTFEKRGKVINDLLKHWRDNKTFSCLKGWRDEVYPVFDGNHEIAFNIERSGIALFGFRAYGCHINGYVEDPETHKLKMWIAQRSFTKQTFPGKLDNIVAGGVSFPYNPTETAIKECLEEASMPSEISKQVTVKNILLL